jgi:hypothetical protein
MRKLSVSIAVALAVLLSTAPVGLFADSRHSADPVETAFLEGGQITMVLSAGGYRISESPDNQIRLRWSVRDERNLRRVRADTEVDGSEATIVMDGPKSNFQATIEVPARSDLTIRLSAGELSVEDIRGDKDIRLRAGELNIDVGHPEDYGHVEASVTAGEIDAAPFDVGTGGLFRSFEWEGDGEYELRARLMAGELSLY